MRFKQFLLETRTRKAVTEADAANWIAKNAPKYWDALMHESTQPIYRGESGFDNDFILTNSGTGRKSLTGPNFVTLLVDSSDEWKDYPKRGESFICSTSLGYAGKFGPSIYLMIPTDTAMIAIAPKDDFWYSFSDLESLKDRSNYNFGIEPLNYAMLNLLLLHKNINDGGKVIHRTVLNGDIEFASASALKTALDDTQKFLETYYRLSDFGPAYKFDTIGELISEAERLEWDNADIEKLEFLRDDLLSNNLSRAMALLFAARGEKLSKFVESLLNPTNNSIELVKASDGFDHRVNKEVWFSGDALMIYRSGNDDNYQQLLDSINEELNK